MRQYEAFECHMPDLYAHLDVHISYYFIDAPRVYMTIITVPATTDVLIHLRTHRVVTLRALSWASAERLAAAGFEPQLLRTTT